MYKRQAELGERLIVRSVEDSMARGTVAVSYTHLDVYKRQALLRVYNRYGRRDNLFKARIKILVNALGIVEFTRQVEDEWSFIKDGPTTLTDEEFSRIAAHFAPPAYESLPANDADFNAAVASDKAFSAWAKRSLHVHKIPGYTALTLSLIHI